MIDRGFRDAIGVIQSLGLDVAIPSLLDNRHIKEFKYFANTVQNSSLMYLQADLSIACALINRYRPPIATSKPEDIAVGKEIQSLITKKNRIETVSLVGSLYNHEVCHLVFQLLTQNNLMKRPSVWETTDHIDLIDDFPMLSEEEIGNITLGAKLQLRVFVLMLRGGTLTFI